MLHDLFIGGYFNYRQFIYDNQVSLELSPNDLVILITLLDNYLKGDKKINVEDLEEKVLMHKNEINDSLSNLLEKAFYSVDLVNLGNGLIEQININPFLRKVEDFYKTENNDNKKILNLIERKSKKLLTASDYENINNLIATENYTLKDFQDTISYLEKAKLNISVRNITKYIEKKIELDTSNSNVTDIKKILEKMK